MIRCQFIIRHIQCYEYSISLSFIFYFHLKIDSWRSHPPRQLFGSFKIKFTEIIDINIRLKIWELSPPPPSSPHIYTQRIWILKIANYGGCFLILSWSRFRISLLLSIKNDVKCACRKLHSAVHTCLSEDAWPYIQKGPRRIGGKKTLNDAPSHHANALTQQLCMHTTHHCAMTTLYITPLCC